PSGSVTINPTSSPVGTTSVLRSQPSAIAANQGVRDGLMVMDPARMGRSVSRTAATEVVRVPGGGVSGFGLSSRNFALSGVPRGPVLQATAVDIALADLGALPSLLNPEGQDPPSTKPKVRGSGTAS